MPSTGTSGGHYQEDFQHGCKTFTFTTSTSPAKPPALQVTPPTISQSLRPAAVREETALSPGQKQQAQRSGSQDAPLPLCSRPCLTWKDMMLISTADNLAEKLNQAVEWWRLTGRVITRVHDNARNVVLANCPSRVNWASVPCFAHTLQLAINNRFAAHLKPLQSLQLA